MKTPEQIKGAVRNVAKNNHIQPQAVLQMYLFERILERLSVSAYKKNFILKGGLIISSMLGLSERTTMDMDTTVTGVDMEEDTVVLAIREILAMDVGDGIDFVFKDIKPIREDDEYSNFRVGIEAKYGKICVPMKIDITAGDKITPAAVRYEYGMMFENKTIPVMAYTLETILAEKYETILRRNIGNTRARDYYDLYALFRLRKNEVDIDILKEAVKNISENRGSTELMNQYSSICERIKADEYQREIWQNYILINPFAQEISFDDIVDNVLHIAKLIAD